MARTHSGDQRRPARLVREVWRLKAVSPHAAVATIYEVDGGLELHVTYQGDIIETVVSRTGEAPLLQRAEAAKQALVSNGWTEISPQRRAR